jgi:hypothetical protein
MDKKTLLELRHHLRRLKHRYFLVAALACGLFSVYAVRQNNLHMVQLREAVYAADKNNGDVETALRDLREYVYTHMNTNLDSGNNAIKPPIQLKYTYQRLQEAAQQGSNAADDNVLYSQAQAYCEQLFPHGLSGSGRIPCIQQYITSHNLHQAQTVDPSLYQFDFTSASWSFDRAGWSIILTALLALLGAGLWLVRRWLHARL